MQVGGYGAMLCNAVVMVLLLLQWVAQCGDQSECFIFLQASRQSAKHADSLPLIRLCNCSCQKYIDLSSELLIQGSKRQQDEHTHTSQSWTSLNSTTQMSPAATQFVRASLPQNW